MEKISVSSEINKSFSGIMNESKNVADAPHILDQLKKISDLKLDDFIKTSAKGFENTVKEMFSVIKRLEGHLKSVLELNSALRVESRNILKNNHEMKRQSSELEEKIMKLEKDAPLVEDLEKRLELTVGEVEKYKGLYKLETQKVENLQKDMQMLNSLIARYKVERDDTIKIAQMLEHKIKSMDESEDKREIQNLKHKLAELTEEKRIICEELELAKGALREIHIHLKRKIKGN